MNNVLIRLDTWSEPVFQVGFVPRKDLRLMVPFTGSIRSPSGSQIISVMLILTSEDLSSSRSPKTERVNVQHIVVVTKSW